MTRFLRKKFNMQVLIVSMSFLEETARRSSQIKDVPCRVLVAHAYNPSYSGGRDQEDGGSKPAQANSS
jgi:hypothetical protein